jgi:hypothetical protein
MSNLELEALLISAIFLENTLISYDIKDKTLIETITGELFIHSK